MNPTPIRSPLAQAAITRAVQLVEDDGPLEDGQAMRQSFAAQADGAGRVHERAALLGQRLGLGREWARWRHLGGGVVLVLALVVVFAAWGLARVVLGDAREINVVAAFVSLLGLHGLTLLLWLASLLVPLPTAGGALGRWALQLTARLPLDRGPHAVQLARATSDVLGRARLAPWAFGGVSHGIWTLSFVLLLVALALGFSLRAYRLTWETTILTPEFFVQFVRATGWLPQRLGFAVPDAATLLQPALAGADAQRAWAWWLLGCVAVYGLAVRVLCGLWCWAMWRRGQGRLRLDLADPYVRRLLARFEAMEPAQIIDVEHAADAPVRALVRAAPETAERWLLGFELPPETEWPPLQGPWHTQRIEGTQQERAAVLQALAAAPPHKLLIACHAPSSPDRGTERFVREACGLAGACGLLLLGARQEADAARWRDWLQRGTLAKVQLHTEAQAAQAWLEAA
ncbi:DUF2868 domain-containing protein [Pseudorhodoferax sp. Leaf267]|uniref:DUF2868 domain-containing protein n=1 Tax=Pseudorhodoferax sp. Leaf267 TaxID=1736316 RepID=UPI0006FF3E37|nr:DUF2868 domain-containing protein [Pseudorhodoferax sp. Leaf267]KQP23112.1 hypothetical protein ASF43_04300 [Pseudorhodoferax sp. Leaf267]